VAPARRRIDPDGVPSPVKVAKDDCTRFPSSTPYVMASKGTPPLANTPVRVIDEGNASYRVLRPTLNTVPATKETAKLCKVPVALVVRPLADPGPDEAPVPLVEHPGGEGPIRCSRCKAYISHLSTFSDGGRRYTCPFCFHANSVPDAYFCNLDHMGRRHDLAERPELVRGTVEYPAPATYCARPPQVPALLFLIDVSYNAVQNGLLGAATQAIRATIDQHAASRPGQLLRMGIITFDTSIHFYNLTADLAQPQMMIVSDVEDVFTPLHKGLLVDGVKSKEVINALLDSLPKQFATTRHTEPAFGAAVRAAVMSVKDFGGRVMTFLTTIPSTGPGKLPKREDAGLLGTDNECKLLAERDDFYAMAAKDCCKYGIAFDLYLAPNSYIDIASLSPLANLTGGSINR
jgi:protein transport protein SEC24